MKKLIILLMLCSCVYASEGFDWKKEYKEQVYKCNHNIKFENSKEICQSIKEEKEFNRKCELHIEFLGSEEYCSDYFYYKHYPID